MSVCSCRFQEWTSETLALCRVFEQNYVRDHPTQTQAPLRVLAKKLNVAPSTVLRNFRSPRTAPPRVRLPRLCPRRARRLRFLEQLASETVTWRGMVEPKYSCSRELSDVLSTKHGISVAPSTIRADLKALGYKAFVRPYCGEYRPGDESNRLCKVKPLEKLEPTQVLYTDEKIFDTNYHGNRTVYAKSREKVAPRMRAQRYNVASIHVWGVIGHNFQRYYVLPPGRMDAQRYIDEVLKKLPLAELQRKGFKYFQQDGARCHTAAITKDYVVRRMKMNNVDWPARSPDLNPVETVWALMKAKIGRHRPVTQEELMKALQECKLPIGTINKLIRGTKKRYQECIRKRGGKLNPLWWKRLVR